MNTDTLQNHWLLGGAAIDLAHFPRQWQPVLAELPPEQQNLTALALMSHFQGLSEYPDAAEALTPLMPLQELTLPPLEKHAPQAHRLIKRLLEESDRYYTLPILNFLAARGYALSPYDYFQYIANDHELIRALRHHPSPVFSQLYKPWQNYWASLQAHLHSAQLQRDLHIDADNWADFAPAQCLEALTHLRLKDPDACRELIAQCIGQESAEVRLRILDILYQQLSAADAPYLQSLLNDRSQKVATLAKQLLMRTGYARQNEADADDADLQMLAKGFEIRDKKSKGLSGLIRHIMGKTAEKSAIEISAVFYKEANKRMKRQELLKRFGLPALAQALGMSLMQLVTGWAYDKNRIEDNHVFNEQASHLPDEYMAPIIANLGDYGFENIFEIQPIWHRFPSAQQQALLRGYLFNPTLEMYFNNLIVLNTPFTEHEALSWQALQKSNAWKNLFDKKSPSGLDEDGCLALGLLLPRELAKSALHDLQNHLSRLSQEEIMQHDLRFYTLRLNAELEPAQSTE